MDNLVDHSVHRLGTQFIALVDPDNVASARVAEKAGMTCRKETVRPCGKRMYVFMKESG